MGIQCAIVSREAVAGSQSMALCFFCSPEERFHPAALLSMREACMYRTSPSHVPCLSVARKGDRPVRS